ncbi:PHA/PHB synthase family protein [Marinivivus vitaminiproducens]|uniref:PHA/PHB synthase family protein n=1 Tax=Marinivivus vitaminiproducens TaxID=3035935 RepID=UPI00279AD924|nr:class I poly(R)-hydroxyalkanoic acid synthase [Geminicoccaceae bacterium SCSIO 64248]
MGDQTINVKDQATAAVDTEELTRILGEIAEQSQRIVQDFVARQEQTSGGDPLNVSEAFVELTQRLMSNPAHLMQTQFALWQDYIRLWQNTAQKMMGQEVTPVVRPERSDRRFKDKAWEENVLFDFIKQSYLLTARWMLNTIGEVEGIDPATKRKIDFYAKHYVDAIAPSNFVLTNPEVLKATIESRGENLLRGLKNMLSDLESGKGKLNIRMADVEAFEIGRNVATTPGKVVYQNELMQLIQYEPTTEQAHKRPLLIIPPWINKFYILDLQPKNSFIKYCVEQGFTTFVISWVNPDKSHADKGFEDYMDLGPLAALDAIEQATGERDANVIGYCIGGTMLSATLAYMQATGDKRFKAVTFLTTLMDFARPGDLGVFIDEEQLKHLESQMEKQGYLDGREMASTFNMLRANDLIWSFVVNNYLLGKAPFPFDLLYWNSDSTRLPRATHSFYLRKCYQQNKLIQPGGITLKGVPIDLSTIRVPTYFLSTREDHIAPWTATFSGFRTVRGTKRMVLAGSGHIAGVINAPAAQKYGYWAEGSKTARTPEAWLESATHHEGSWWPDWAAWNAAKAGPMVPARRPGDGGLAVIEDAPGSYVKVRA